MLQIVLSGELRSARAIVEGANARYAELLRSGSVLPTNAVRTCPTCGEPGGALYAANHGPHVMHCYQCTDKECAQRWLTGEYAMAEAAGQTDFGSIEDCLSMLRVAATTLEQDRVERRRKSRIAT